MLTTWCSLCWTNQNVTTELRHPGSLGTAQKQHRENREKERAGGAVWGQRERRDERKDKVGGEIKREKERKRDLLPCLSLKVAN